MDMRTGQTYESAEAALAAGVPASDIAEVDAKGKLKGFYREPFKAEENPSYPPHQGKRELARRLAQQSK